MDLAALIDQFADFKTFIGAIEDIVGALQDLFDEGSEGEPSAADAFSSLSSTDDDVESEGLSSALSSEGEGADEEGSSSKDSK